MKMPSPPKFLRPSPSRPGKQNGRNGGADNGGATPAAPTGKDRTEEATASTGGWLDERTGLSPFLRGFLYRKVPKGTNWYYTPGSAPMFPLPFPAVNGGFLGMDYQA